MTERPLLRRSRRSLRSSARLGLLHDARPRAEDEIPQRRRDPEAAEVVTVVVLHVVLLQELADARRLLEVVNRVVAAVVAEVTKREPDVERLREAHAAREEVEERVEQHGHRQARAE